MFETFSYFHPSLIFGGKAGAYLLVTPYETPLDQMESDWQWQTL